METRFYFQSDEKEFYEIRGACDGFLLSCMFRKRKPKTKRIFIDHQIKIKASDIAVEGYVVDHIISLGYAAQAFREYIEDFDPTITQVCKLGSSIRDILNEDENLCKVSIVQRINEKESRQSDVIKKYFEACHGLIRNSLSKINKIDSDYCDILISIINNKYVNRLNKYNSRTYVQRFYNFNNNKNK